MNKPKRVLFKFIKVTFKAYKPYYLSLMLLSIITAIINIFGAYSVSYIIKYLENGIYKEAIICGIVVTLIEVFLNFLRKYLQKVNYVHQQKMSEIVNQIIANKIMSLPFEYLENPYYLELKKNSEMGINNMGAIYNLMNSFSTILSSVLSLIGLGTIIFSFDPWLMLVMFGGIVLNVLIIVLASKIRMAYFKKLLPINFRYGYYFWTLYNPQNSKDFRYYKTYDSMYENFNTYADKITHEFVLFHLKSGVFTSLNSAIRYIQMAFIYSLVGIKTLVNKLPISSFTLTVSSAMTFSNCITSIIEASENFIRSVEYIKPMIELLEVKEDADEGTVELEEIKSIKFDNVCFTYPNTTKEILSNVSFEVNSNEKISIVGLNGAGKTTIIKLLCRLYHPNSGQILINDIPISEYKYNTYIKQISAIFQDYKLFGYSIRENISDDMQLEQIKEIAEDVGISEAVEKLPNQYETTLLKSFEEDSMELSGGQRQKIAIARALAKNSSLLILDEPTSALDPLAEAEIYENFNSLAKNKMAIYISHRMSSSIFCDKILILDNGQISDFDSHDNLMKKKDSLYYKLFMTQAKNYSK